MSGTKSVIFIGSSVCLGTGATNDRGWSTLWGEKLMAEGWTVSNCSIGGQTTADILLRLERDVITKHPDVCVVGLGLANEGLPGAKTETEGRIIQGIFESNLQKIREALERAGIRVILGGVYPNNNYGPMQYALLRETFRRMETRGVPVLQWLDALEDGQGHFREGLYADAGHPNDAGYRVMAQCIPGGLL
ncbi:MAG: hypothetical protein CW338_11495 [Clostridiales bacterium]|nr:hypothetical protein [Clostridiales bacterium]